MTSVLWIHLPDLEGSFGFVVSNQTHCLVFPASEQSSWVLGHTHSPALDSKQFEAQGPATGSASLQPMVTSVTISGRSENKTNIVKLLLGINLKKFKPGHDEIKDSKQFSRLKYLVPRFRSFLYWKYKFLKVFTWFVRFFGYRYGIISFGWRWRIWIRV